VRSTTVASILAMLLSGCSSVAPTKTADVRDAEPAPAALDWAAVDLPGKRSTRYTALVRDGRPAVHAKSESAASFLRRAVRLEADQLRTVQFSWRVEELIAEADMSDRDTDDSPVRVILAFDGDHSQLSMRNRMTFDLAHAVTGERPPYATLMYVWDNKAPTETVIHSGRTDRIRKIVVESGGGRLGQWHDYERDIVADYRRSFGEAPGRLISVGLMTDSDNTRSRAEAWYGEVRVALPVVVTHPVGTAR
jgi:Protein of unknown function (DUF3047)